MRRSGTSKLGILLGLSLPLLYCANYFITPNVVGIVRLETGCRPRGGVRFDSGKWKEPSASAGKRYEMVDSLLADGILPGVNVAQLRDLLGRPDMTQQKDGDQLLFYMLGTQNTFPSRSFWFPGLFANCDRWFLEIRLHGGKVESARVFFT
jgi:hypothetical protein